ncbi:hypothetical protein KEF85_04885 [Methylomonas paludis]|uniref:Uncharacterized protein n=1 Tax=Methylomonas paludis TaxID=1173101 RepID=A0A975R9V3_9GAMM|nr:hypothetical protein [Methylomonas paludis]QWF71810.1 hypothetical protein KEF85_04885 [Methylomonas paludis]
MRAIAILHEGKKDNLEQVLLLQLLQELKLPSEKCQLYAMGSKSNFFKSEHVNYQRLGDLVNADQVDKILFVLDADDAKNDVKFGGYDNTSTHIQSMINTLGWQAISDFYIVCNPGTSSGYLESLVLASLPEHQRLCINNFLSCSEFRAKDHHKDIYRVIYEIAFPQAPWNFQHPHFQLLKEKLQALF